MTLTAAVLLFAVSQKVPPPKTQHVDFGEELISGDLSHPDAELTLGLQRPKFGNLIKVRQNFSDKIVKSVEQM